MLASRAKAGEADGREWQAFKDRFLFADGRVVDTGNQGVTHTEGQGWGMIFAEFFDDQPSFTTIWGWTTRNLRRPHDALHFWRFDPSSTTPTADTNNATDGDLFIGLALSRAARRWGRADYAESARAIRRDLVRLLVRTVAGRTVLLPGVQGFETGSEVVVNPSYMVFPAIRELVTAGDQPEWNAVQRDGAALIEEACFGRWRLPPDWLRIDRASGKLTPAPNWPPRFSYDAVRVPLYLRWAGLPSNHGLTDFYSAFGGKPPAWVDLVTNETAPYVATPGMLAIASLVSASPGKSLPAEFPLVAAAPDYYSAALTLLSRVAWRETLN